MFGHSYTEGHFRPPLMLLGRHARIRLGKLRSLKIVGNVTHRSIDHVRLSISVHSNYRMSTSCIISKTQQENEQKLITLPMPPVFSVHTGDGRERRANYLCIRFSDF